jgi:hypothetical protein
VTPFEVGDLAAARESMKSEDQRSHLDPAMDIGLLHGALQVRSDRSFADAGGLADANGSKP